MKPKAFIGSSVKGLDLAYAIQQELQYDIECTIWSQGIFQPGKAPIEALTKALDEHDFAIFVFLPEDVVTIKGRTSEAVRDNVLFELGLFIGKLGRDRNIFIMPQGEENARIATDLAGIIPATYNPDTQNLRVAVSRACYDIRNSVRELAKGTLYDSERGFKSAHFKGVKNYVWKDRSKVGEIAQGSLQFESDGVIRIERTNTAGRFQIELRQNGPDNPSFVRKQDPVYRALHVSCDAKVDVGEHTLRFVLKDEKAKEWVAKESRKINARDWEHIEFYLHIPTTVDVFLRIDDEAVSQAPSNVYIRKLKIVEEK